MKTLYTILTFLLITMLFIKENKAQYVTNQEVSMSVTNKVINAGTFEFDIYLNRTSSSVLGAVYLGSSDIVFLFDPTQFTAPTYSFKAGVFPSFYCTFRTFDNTAFDNGSLQNNYETVGWTSPAISGNKLLIALNAGTPANLTQMHSSCAYIDDKTNTYRLGTFTISGCNVALPSTVTISLYDVLSSPPTTKLFGFDSTNQNTYMMGLGSLLPIELASFTAQWLNSYQNDALVSWTTASEINNDHFRIEKSSNLDNWGIVTTVSSKAVNGNSNTDISYSIIDEAPYNHITYYRLIQVDINGEETAYDPKAITKSQESSSVFIYPNPTTELLFVSSDLTRNEAVKIRIYDIKGALVKSKDVDMSEGANLVEIDVIDLETALYTINIIGDSFNHHEMIVIN